MFITRSLAGLMDKVPRHFDRLFEGADGVDQGVFLGCNGEEWKFPTKIHVKHQLLVPEVFVLLVLVPFVDGFLVFLFLLISRVQTHYPDMYTSDDTCKNHVAIYNIPRPINQVKPHLDSCHADGGAEWF